MDDFYEPGGGIASGPPKVEQARYQPRFRVVTRRALDATARSAASPSLHFPVALAVIPTACLLVYLVFWTLAMRGGFYQGQLQAQLEHERIVRLELEADLNRKRAPAWVAPRARALGMVPAGQRVFASSKPKQ